MNKLIIAIAFILTTIMTNAQDYYTPPNVQTSNVEKSITSKMPTFSVLPSSVTVPDLSRSNAITSVYTSPNTSLWLDDVNILSVPSVSGAVIVPINLSPPASIGTYRSFYPIDGNFLAPSTPRVYSDCYSPILFDGIALPYGGWYFD